MEKQNISWSFYFSVTSWLAAWKPNDHLLNSLAVLNTTFLVVHQLQKKCNKHRHRLFSDITTAWEISFSSRWSYSAGVHITWTWEKQMTRKEPLRTASSQLKHFSHKLLFLKRWVTCTQLSQSGITHRYIVKCHSPTRWQCGGGTVCRNQRSRVATDWNTRESWSLADLTWAGVTQRLPTLCACVCVCVLAYVRAEVDHWETSGFWENLLVFFAVELVGGGLRVYKSSLQLDRAGKVAGDEEQEVIYKLLTRSRKKIVLDNKK